MALRRQVARWLVRRVLRPGLAPAAPLARRRRAVERSARLLPLPRGVRRRPADPGGPAGEWWLPAGVTTDCPRGAILYLHGGGFVLGSPASHRAVAAQLARRTALPVLLLDYRLAPEHPFPAAYEDALEAWRSVTLAGARPAALAADSAGGWLAMALALRAPAASLPAATGLALFSPLLDLARAEAAGGDAADLMLPPGFVAEGVRAWRGAIPAGDARLDLLAAPLAELPPLFVSFDRDEWLAADTRRLVGAARAAGHAPEVEERAGLWHAWPLFAGLLPEADASLRRAAGMLAPRSGAVA